MYQTLYRKYRSKKFSELVGQDVIVKTLKNSIKNEKISHAYLFVGPRGTGKTSTAKIFARAVNCLDNDAGEICGKCSMCNISNSSECLDIIEIDAASNNGVDEIRNLRDKVNLVPNQLKYKVYIIDEVHMLTIQAFNALLKTLEEPPEHIIFILATTDIQKVPETIISRCQCFNFSRMTQQNIIDNLSKICNEEKINIDLEVLKQISLAADGGMRDALSILDKLISYGEDNIKLDDFLQLNGLVTVTEIESFINYIFSKDVKNVIDQICDWNLKGKNLIQIMMQSLEYLKDKLIRAYTDNNDINTNKYQMLANLLNEKMINIKKSSNPNIYIEIILLDFISSLNNELNISREIIPEKSSSDNNVSRETLLESKNTINYKQIEKKDITNSLDEQNSNIRDIMNVRINNTFIDATKNELKQMINEFSKLNDYVFDQNIGYLVCALLEGKIRLSSSEYIVISYEYDSVVSTNIVNYQKMESVLKDILNINKKIAIISDSDWNKVAKDFIENKKNNISYEYIEEPELLFDKTKKIENNTNNKNNDSISDVFGDIVEIY